MDSRYMSILRNEPQIRPFIKKNSIYKIPCQARGKRERCGVFEENSPRRSLFTKDPCVITQGPFSQTTGTSDEAYFNHARRE